MIKMVKNIGVLILILFMLGFVSSVVCGPGQIIGDVNSDEAITQEDVNLATDISIGKIPIPSNICCVDVNQDGSFNIGDAVIINRIVNGYEVSPGICSEQKTQDVQCTDTDSGMDYTARGIVTDRSGEYTDQCFETTLTEYYCKDNLMTSTNYNCPINCLNGACTETEGKAPACADSDGGINYLLKGTLTDPTGSYTDQCFGNKLTEYYCKASLAASTKHTCSYPQECFNGACTETKNGITITPNETEEVQTITPNETEEVQTITPNETVEEQIIPSRIEHDFNSDGILNDDDLIVLARELMEPTQRQLMSQEDYLGIFDINRDGSVSLTDLLAFDDIIQQQNQNQITGNAIKQIFSKITGKVTQNVQSNVLCVPHSGDVAPRNGDESPAYDEMVNIGDAVILLRMVIGQITPTDQDILCGDVGPIPISDNRLTIGDAVILLRAVIGMIDLEHHINVVLSRDNYIPSEGILLSDESSILHNYNPYQTSGPISFSVMRYDEDMGTYVNYPNSRITIQATEDITIESNSDLAIADIWNSQSFSITELGSYMILVDFRPGGGAPQIFGHSLFDVSGVAPGENLKDTSRYSNREVFLVSDENWEDVLPLVPLTTWTAQTEEEFQWCLDNGYVPYGGAPNVCSFPTLIYHKEGNSFDMDSIIYFMQQYNAEKVTLVTSGINSFESNCGDGIDNDGDGYTDTLNINNLQEGYILPIDDGRIVEIDEFLHSFLFGDEIMWEVSDFDGEIIFHRTPTATNDYSFVSGLGDVYYLSDHIVNEWAVDRDCHLLSLLEAPSDFGAGINENNINLIIPNNYLSYWGDYEQVVYVENNYELALLASTYASLINAPLVIEGTSLDSDNIFVNRNIICVGDVDRACNEQYTLEQLQGRYVELTQTDKIVLVNPNDLDMHINEFFPTEKLDRVNQIYSKTSLAAPILASAKHEVMTFTNNYDYLQADQEFTNQFLNMYNFQQSDFHTIECRFGDACSSEPDIYRIPVKQSIGDTVSYRFNTNGINNYENLHFGYLYTDASCGLENGDDAFVTINSNEYRAYLNIGEMPNGELFSLGKYMFFNLGRDELDEGLFADSLWDVEIRIPGCRIFRRTDVWYGDNILTATGNGGMRQVIDFEEETNIQDGEIEVLGLNEGNSAFFNFENLNPNLDYKIVVTTSRSNLCENGEEFCRGTFIDNEFTTYIRGSQIEDGRVEIEVRGGDSLQENYHILPITSVQLYPQISEHYLTILASPDAIQMSRSSGFTMFQSEINYQLEIYYETIDNQYNPFPSIGNVVRLPEDANNYRLLTGRIFGISLSDVSGNIARNLFFDKIPKDKSASFIWRGISADTTADEIRNSLNSNSENLIYDEFPDGVYTCYSYNDPEVGCDIDIPELVQSYIDSYFTLYSDHGSYNWAGVSSSALRYKYLQPKTSYISACSTCDFVDAKNRNNAQNLLCMQILRRGGLNYIGSQSIARISSSGSSIPSEVSSMVLDKEIIGRVWESHQKRAQGWDIYYVLIGDPTFKPIYWDEPRSEE